MDPDGEESFTRRAARRRRLRFWEDLWVGALILAALVIAVLMALLN